MKKLKLFLGVALFGAMSLGAFSAYDYYTMNEEERFFLANIEALTNDEGTPVGVCAIRVGPSGKLTTRIFCDSRTASLIIYPCLQPTSDFCDTKYMDRCTK